MAAAVTDYEHLEPIPIGYGYAGILFSIVFFQSINQLLLRIGSPTSVRKEDVWKWRNLFVSWIHAVIIGAWDLSCFYRYPELMTDLIAYHNMYTYLMIAFSTGYFVYDFIDIVVNKQTMSMWAVIPHHFAVAGMFFYNVVQCRCIAYNVVALLAEVNSIFLHARKLLQMAGFSFNGLLYRANAAANLATFVGCRFLGLGWIIYGMFVWYHRVARFYFVVLGVAMFVMWVTNAILFKRLICSDLLRPLGRRSKLLCGATSTLNVGTVNGISMPNGNGNLNHNLSTEICRNGAAAANGAPPLATTLEESLTGVGEDGVAANGGSVVDENHVAFRRRNVDHAVANGSL